MSTETALPAIKETKAQKAERLKREKNPWECLEEIRAFARHGHGSIPEDWLKTYFKWWGVYTQGDGAGGTGGSGGESHTTQYFMIRIRLSNGFLRSSQLHSIASIAEKYARSIADITVRQNIQLHWITIQDLPNVLEELFECGLTSLATCGDVTRNITGCPLAGVPASELEDASPLLLAATKMLAGNPDFYMLPPNAKISISGWSDGSPNPKI